MSNRTEESNPASTRLPTDSGAGAAAIATKSGLATLLRRAIWGLAVLAIAAQVFAEMLLGRGDAGVLDILAASLVSLALLSVGLVAPVRSRDRHGDRGR